MEKLLEIQDLHISFKTYGGEVKAVRGVNLHVNKGEVLGIVGESGCGKSVTVHSIMRLLPDSAQIKETSSILFKGQDIVEKSEKEMQKIRGNEISMIFQDPMTSLNPTMKVGKQIGEVLQKHQNTKAGEVRTRAIEMLEMVGIPQPEKRVDQYPHEFSGGMRQRVMIAIALAGKPQLLIADEPTTALDVTIQMQILRLMKDLQSKLETSIILITHDLGVVAEMCDRIAVMYAGQVVEVGTAADIYYRPNHPYTISLLKSIPRLDMRHDEPLTPILGTPPDLFNPPVGCPFFARCSKAMSVCESHNPQLENLGPDHYSACWLNHPLAQTAGNSR